MDTHAVGFVVQSQYGQQDQRLELPEWIMFLISSTLHAHNVEDIPMRVKRFLDRPEHGQRTVGQVAAGAQRRARGVAFMVNSQYIL